MSITINVFGPRRTSNTGNEESLWSAQVELVSTPKFADEPEAGQASDVGHPAARSTFLGDWPNSNLSIFSEDHVQAPGTYLALCRVLSVTLHLGRKALTLTGNSQLASFVPLLLQAVPADWVDIPTPAQFPAGQFPDSTLLAGEIAAAGLDPTTPDLSLALPGFENVDSLVFNASGFSFNGSLRLPWQLSSDTALRGPMQAFFPFPNAGAGELRVQLDRARLDKTAEASWTGAFTFLRQLLAGAPGTSTPWAQLSLSTSPIPQFSWRVISGVPGNPVLRLELGEIRLSLSQSFTSGAAILSAPATAAFTTRRASDTTMLVQITSDVAAPTSPQGLWHYTATRGGDGLLAEAVAVNEFDTQYDAIALAADLRQRLSLPVPDASAEDRIAPALLWTGLRLENGWAQVPFFNVTEAAYLRAEVPPPALGPQTQLFRGAAIFGNDESEQPAAAAGEQPWSVTLLDAASFAGTWTFQRAAVTTGTARDWSIGSIDLSLPEPELALDGFFWFGTDAPTSRDALPSLDNWVAGVASLPLRTADARTLYPSPHILHFKEVKFTRGTVTSRLAIPPGPEAELGTWQASFRPNPASYDLLVRQALALGTNGAVLLKDPPLVWQRHPRMPCIQAVPLTQNQRPPSYPSPSRELAPFDLPLQSGSTGSVPAPDPSVWIFGNAQSNGAKVWPQFLTPLKPAVSWKTLPLTGEDMPELGLASLSIPGLSLDHTLQSVSPIPEAANAFLPLQFRFDLPYTDEVNALAELPRDPSDPPLAPPPPLPPLQRADFPAFWQDLRQKALLASVDAAPALSVTGSQTFVTGLVEPLAWPVTPSLDTTSYPGTLRFQDGSQTMTLKANDGSLLRGFHGDFKVTGTQPHLQLQPEGTAGDFRIVAGSMSAAVAGGEIRDQRGLSRAATVAGASGSRLLKTTVERSLATGSDSATLCSLTAPLSLTAGDRTWRFWARDLPVITEPGVTHFNRAHTQSSHHEDVNDPEADSPPFIHLAGYEWRLGDNNALGGVPQPLAKAALQLFGLQVFPLTLEEVVFDATDRIVKIVMTARLQLPRSLPVELTNVDNAARLTFSGPPGALAMTDVAPLPATTPGGVSECVWQLDDKEEGPLLRVRSFTVAGGALTFGGVLEFHWMNAIWQVQIDPAHLPFTNGHDPRARVSLLVPAVSSTASVALKSVLLYVSFDPAIETFLAPILHFQWGDPGALLFTVDRTVTLCGTPPPPPEPAVIPVVASLVANGTTFLVTPKGTPPVEEVTAIQIAWTLNSPAPGTLQALPGMHLSRDSESTGFAAMSFIVAPPLPKSTIPTLLVQAGAFEGLFSCRWNKAIRDLAPVVPESNLFQSSAGDLIADYTLEAAVTVLPSGARSVIWNPRLLLNGWLETVNLISWPAQAAIDAGDTLATISDFASGSAQLPAGADATLSVVARQIKAHPEWVVHLEGHADATAAIGTVSNEVFSRRRALSVRAALVADGVPASQLVVVAYGDTRLAVAGTGDPQNQTNRRVEVHRHASVALPPVRATGSTLDHLRHSIRVLFNQHAVENKSGPIIAAGRGLALFGLSDPWQFLGVVEHQIAAVRLAATPNVTTDHRWSVVQEIRLATPSAFRTFLQQLRNFNGLDPKNVNPAPLPQTLAGYANPTFLDLLLGRSGMQGELDKLGNVLLVEASVPLWVRPLNMASGQFTALQYLPSGAQRAILTSLPELETTPDQKPGDLVRSWYLLTLPFLGRLQSSGDDTTGPALSVDPIAALKAIAPTASIPPLWLALTSRQNTVPLTISLSDFDTLAFRRTARLDSSTLIEGWFRLQTPPAESDFGNGLAPVMSSLPAYSPGRLGRAAALNSAFRALRTSLPPGATDGTSDDAANGSTLVWRHLSLLAVQGISNLPMSGNPEITAQGFFFGGIQLQALLARMDGVRTLHAAVTVLPASLVVDTARNRQPVSYALSPFAALQFDPQPVLAASVTESLLKAELLTLDLAGPAPRFISPANQQWLGDSLAKSTIPPTDTQGANDVAVAQWAAETASRVAGDSPLAVVRIRSVTRPDPLKADIVTGFRFLLVPVAAPPNLAPPSQALRAPLDRLHFQEGQYGGAWMADSLLEFEAAPPQTAGVQPFWFLTGASEVPGQASRPLRLSALRLSVNHYITAGPNDGGVAGPATGAAGNKALFRLWWAASAQQITFALPAKQRLLPPAFRASSIDSLLPAPSGLPLPAWEDLEVGPSDKNAGKTGVDAFQFWQPVVEDRYHVLLTGGRAGAPVAFRNHLITQFASDAGASMASGSVPVQHRFPRPVPLPANNEPDIVAATALQPWPALFRAIDLPEAGLPSTDNATFDRQSDADAFAVQITLAGPSDGLLHFDLAGNLQFDVSFFKRDGLNWSLVPSATTPTCTIQVDLFDGTRRLSYPDLVISASPSSHSFSLLLDADPSKAGTKLRTFLISLPHGAPLFLELRVPPPGSTTGITGYVQTLRFPLRLARPGERLLPLMPVVMQFEDPEYNRRLSSTPAQQTGVITAGGVTSSVILAADRREYNPTTPLFAAFVSKGPSFQRTIRLQRIDPNGGNPIVLEDFPGINSSSLLTTQLSKYTKTPAALVPGDSLEIAVFDPATIDPITHNPQLEIILRVDIVADPVIPSPEAGYALLRREDDESDERVHCARFAWSPTPDRIDLLDPSDLTGKIVRRRAVFQWLDSIRPHPSGATHTTHRIQKINFNGSTHFPAWTV